MNPQTEPLSPRPTNGIKLKKISLWESQTGVESCKTTSSMDPRELSAQELLQRCCRDRNDNAAWEEFVRRFQPLIAGVVLKTLRHRYAAPAPHLVDDLVQDTYLKLCANNYRALRKFVPRHDNSIYEYLKRTASSVALDYLRRRKNKKHGGGQEEEELDEARMPVVPGPPLLDPAERNIRMAEIRSCLAKHASDDRTFARDYMIFTLHHCYGLTANAISKLPSFGLSTKGVESTLFRLFRLLREKLGEHWPPNPPSAPGGDECSGPPEENGRKKPPQPDSD